MVNKNKTADNGRNFFTNIFYSLFGKRSEINKSQIDENAKIKEKSFMKVLCYARAFMK